MAERTRGTDMSDFWHECDILDHGGSEIPYSAKKPSWSSSTAHYESEMTEILMVVHQISYHRKKQADTLIPAANQLEDHCCLTRIV